MMHTIRTLRPAGVLACVLAVSVTLAGQSRSTPAPEGTFGFKAGADYKLATYDQSIAYLKALAASSKYIRLVETGKTTQGRPMYFALISTPSTFPKFDGVEINAK